MLKKYHNYKIINNCRLCGSKKILKVFDFKSVPIGNDLKNTSKKSLNSKKYPLKLMNCKKCNHFQLSISINPKILFAKNYTYLTGVTKTFDNHFKNYAKWIKEKCNLKNSSMVLDIGSNDGTCLKHFKKNNMQILGVDPAKLPASIANKRGIKTINKFFNLKTSDLILKKYGKIDFITSHNVLAHTENINDVFKSIFKLLKEGGYFCFEIGYFYNVVTKNLFDTIYHEHLDYHHAGPLVQFLEKIGFSIINLSTNDIQGGTLRLLLKKNKTVKKKSNRIIRFLKKEKKILNIRKINRKIFNFQKSLILFKQIIIREKLKKKVIYGYGSPTKASLLLSISRLNKNIIKYTFEDNKLKSDKYIPGTDIKILNTKYIKKENPKVIAIFAWNFTKEITSRLIEKDIKNIKIISPLPEPRINII